MPEIPDGAKTPTDRKAKKGAVPEAFSFEHDGTSYTFKPTLDALTPGFIRRNRNNEAEFQYGLVEALADDAALAALDGMSFKENARVMAEFAEHASDVLRVSLGE